MTTLTTELIEQLRTRRTAGESVKALATGLGLSWQKLDKAIRNGLPKGADAKPLPPPKAATRVKDAILTPVEKAGPLTERYRPLRLDGLWGQEQVRSVLAQFARRPFPAAFIFEGETGTGKTSAALALAEALGCRLDQHEFGGVNVIASGEQTADTVRDTWKRMYLTPMLGSGWKVLIVNEADRMNPAAETIWLDCLENVPAHTVVVFTTNFSGKMSQRFRDRCTRLAFESDAARLNRPATKMLSAIWRAETGTEPDQGIIAGVIQSSVEDGKLSFRRLVQGIAPILMTLKTPRKSREN